nr:MAG TPA: hypothetical protein [Bacteriophage sp.]
MTSKKSYLVGSSGRSNSLYYNTLYINDQMTR